MQLLRKFKRCFICVSKAHLAKDFLAVLNVMYACGDGHPDSICDKVSINDNEKEVK